MTPSSATITVWRITTRKFAPTAFLGEGARRFGGRWNPPGFAVAYTAQSQSLALLEMMVQDQPLKARYVLISATIPEQLISYIDINELHPSWRSLAGRKHAQAIGQRWLETCSSAVLGVPSAVLPSEMNYLINPKHPEFSQILLGDTHILDMDSRLLERFQQKQQ